MPEVFNCRNCGTKHKRKECPAYGKKCHRCHKLNHFKAMCRSKKNVNAVERQEDSCFEETLFVGAVTSKVQNDEWYVTTKIEKQKIKLKVDTGSQVKILNLNQLKKITPQPRLKKSTHKLISYTGNNLALLGSTELCVESESNQSRNLTFYIVDTDQPGLLGLRAEMLIENGVEPDEAKVKAINKMEAQTDKNGVGRLLGTVNYLEKFIPNLATLTKPIRELLKKEVEF